MFIRSAIFAAAMIASASSAQAADYLFTLSGADQAYFILPSSPIVTPTGDNESFTIDDVAGTFNGTRGGPATASNLSFYTSRGGGGFESDTTAGSGIFALADIQLFTGTIGNPTFTLGSYDFATNYDGETVNDHLTITEVTSYLFTLTGTDTASFILPASPAINPTGDNEGFTLDNVAGTFNGTRGGPATASNLSFYTTPGGGGFESVTTTGSGIFSLSGAQLFTGTIGMPTFTLGSYDFATNYDGEPVNDRLTITAILAAPPAVPEAATWAMMIAGFGVIGSTMRRRRTAMPAELG